MIALTGAFAGNAEAIYKCTTPKGVIYQDRPCREGAESDLQLTIPTGELAPKAAAATQDDATQSNATRTERNFGAPRQARAGDDSASTGKSGDKRSSSSGRTGDASASGSYSGDNKRGAGDTYASSSGDDARSRDARSTSADNSQPMTPEQARKADPSAKYYTTDAAAPGADTPQSMTCESPTGEKRLFILSNGKMTSI